MERSDRSAEKVRTSAGTEDRAANPRAKKAIHAAGDLAINKLIGPHNPRGVKEWDEPRFKADFASNFVLLLNEGKPEPEWNACVYALEAQFGDKHTDGEDVSEFAEEPAISIFLRQRDHKRLKATCAPLMKSITQRLMVTGSLAMDEIPLMPRLVSIMSDFVIGRDESNDF